LKLKDQECYSTLAMAPKKSSKRASEEDFDDISYEPDQAGDKLKKLKEELAQCKKERQEYLDGWQRLKADTVNARKAEIERAQKAKSTTTEEIIADILPAIDSFDSAQASASWRVVDEVWRRGVEAIKTQLEQGLARHGITRFGKAGDTFNPTMHEAVREVPASKEHAEGTVVAVIRSGWKANGHIIRPAHVAVAAIIKQS